MVGGKGNELHFCWLLGPSVLEKRSFAVLLSDTDCELAFHILFGLYPELFVNIWIEDIWVLKVNYCFHKLLSAKHTCKSAKIMCSTIDIGNHRVT